MLTIRVDDGYLSITTHAFVRTIERFNASSDLAENILSLAYNLGDKKCYEEVKDIIKYVNKKQAHQRLYIDYADIILVIDPDSKPYKTVITILKKEWYGDEEFYISE